MHLEDSVKLTMFVAGLRSDDAAVTAGPSYRRHSQSRGLRLACVADYLPPHNTLICTVPGLSELECKTVPNGGYLKRFANRAW
jgi:hypothetical protein